MAVNKVSRTIKEQIALLKTRGMLIKDEQAAALCLGYISYFRLKGYWWDMQTDKINHVFAPNSYFEDVIARYNFDRQLRLILFDAIELIEIALRTKLIYHLSQAYGGLWYLNDSLVMDKDKYQSYLRDLQSEFERNGENFSKDFRAKYPNGNPDAWIIFEVATFGTLSKIYSNLKPKIPQKSLIAHEFGLNSISDLSSWFAAISYLRNLIAHHSRLFGRDILKRPILPKTPRNQWLQFGLTTVQEKKPFAVISTMIYLCNAINPNNEIKDKLLALLNNSPNIPIYKLGFFNNWQDEPLWKINEKISEKINNSKTTDIKSDIIYFLINEKINEKINLNDNLKESLCKIIYSLYNKPNQSRIDLIEQIQKGRATTDRYIKILKDANIIELKGSKKTGGYYLTEEMKITIND